VLVNGESGTGKELVARAVHQESPRASGPFVRVSCAAISRDIMESELFGHVKGAFTNATSNKRGFFEQAHGGTLFLDDIGEMDPAAQTKVLRAVQSGEVLRVGAETAIRVDVRVVSATNKDLVREAKAGRFREDLYFRLAVFPIRCPSLSERVDDVRLLADAFLAGFCKESGLRAKTMAGEVYAALERRRWPGNVRELRNVIERAAILAGDVITIADLPEDPHTSPFDEEAPEPAQADSALRDPALREPASGPPPSRLSLAEFRARAERAYIVEVLESLGWNVKQAAEVLRVERTSLHHRIRALKITRPEGAS
jgi:DNA-binding NtrC family response regulator